MTRYSHVCMHCIDHPLLFFLSYHFLSLSRSASGTSIIQVTASDADDPTYGNSARLVYTLVQGQPHFSVDPQTGMCCICFGIIGCLPGLLFRFRVQRISFARLWGALRIPGVSDALRSSSSRCTVTRTIKKLLSWKHKPQGQSFKILMRETAFSFTVVSGEHDLESLLRFPVPFSHKCPKEHSASAKRLKCLQFNVMLSLGQPLSLIAH